ncbi:MAG: PorT family protein [Saprospirales bacterium]|nr:MAG: PorT family protein [Saprospirales bacterium]
MKNLLIKLIFSALLGLLLLTNGLKADTNTEWIYSYEKVENTLWSDSVDMSKFELPNSLELSIPGIGDRTKRNVETRYLVFEMGVDILQPADDYIVGDGEVELFEQRYANSTNVNIYFFRQRVNLLKHHLNLEYGLGFNFHKIMFDNPVIMSRENGILQFDLAPIEGGDRIPVKTRLMSNYLTVPVMFNFETNPSNTRKSFRLAAGVYGNTRMGSNFKQKFNNKRSDNIKDKDNFNLSPFRWGIAGQIGYGAFNFYANYSMTDIFKENRNSGYEVGMVSAGFIFIPF